MLTLDRETIQHAFRRFQRKSARCILVIKLRYNIIFTELVRFRPVTTPQRLVVKFRNRKTEIGHGHASLLRMIAKQACSTLWYRNGKFD